MSATIRGRAPARARRTPIPPTCRPSRVPFDADLPELADLGHLSRRLPRRLREPLRKLTGLLVAAAGASGAPAAVPAAAAGR